MFRPEVCEKLGFYVYRLVDPRDRRTFYVGKGVNNRVFDHVASHVWDLDTGPLSPKLDQIAEIKASGQEVIRVVHRHGLDEETALHVEAALIDAYPGLTNLVRGHGTGQWGAARVEEIMARFQAEEAVWRHPMLLVGIRLTGASRSTYDAARYAWPLNNRKLRQTRYVCAVRDQRIVDVFEPTAWLPATLDNFPTADRSMPGRLGFVGRSAPPDVLDCYVGKRLPNGLKLSQVGIRYVQPTT